MKTRQEINTWLFDNYRKLSNPEAMFSIDNNSCTLESWYTAKLRVLVTFLSPESRKSYSNTYEALYTQATRDLENKEDLFMDCCYLPEFDNMSKLDKDNIPYMFGNVSHAPAQEYDIIMVSLSTFHESVNYPTMLLKSDIPLTIEKREESKSPLILFGGAISSEASLFYGDVYDKDEYLGHSLVDICQYGNAEGVMNVYIPELIKLINQGYSIKEDKQKVIDYLIDNKICRDYLFFCKYYKWLYEDDKFTIKQIKRLDKRVPLRVKIKTTTDEDLSYLGWNTKVFHLNGDNSDFNHMQISSGCTGQSNACSFCHEGTIAKRYKEIPLDMAVDKMRDLKIKTGLPTVYPFCYNYNYYSDFLGISLEMAKASNKLFFINERLDVLAHDDTPLKLYKSLGGSKVSGAIEGIGNRIRNDILNKNLSTEDLVQAMKNIFANKFLAFKAGMIKTGYETDEDINQFIEEIDLILKARDEAQSRASIQFNFTPLVIYSQVSLRYLERKTAVSSLNDEKDMGNLISLLKERGIRLKANSRGIGTYIEQLLIDFGYAGTDWLVACAKDGLLYNLNFTDKHKEIVLSNLEKRGYDPLFFTHPRSFDTIFPNDHIDYASKDVIEQWKARTEYMKFGSKLCLKTFANESPKCHKCKACDNAKEIKEMTKREIKKDHIPIQDIHSALGKNKTNYCIRVVYTLDDKYDFIAKEVLNYRIMALLLQEDSSLVDNYINIADSTLKPVTRAGQKDWFSGTVAFDVNFRYPISQGSLDKLIPKINEGLKTCQVKGIFYNTKDLSISRDSSIGYIGTIDMSLQQVKEKLALFNGNFKVAKQGKIFSTEDVYFPELKDKIVMASKAGKISIYMHLPSKFNPYLVMASLTGKSYKKMLELCAFKVITHTKDIDMTCSCGNNLVYSYFTDGYSKVCPVCQGKYILKNVIK